MYVSSARSEIHDDRTNNNNNHRARLPVEYPVVLRHYRPKLASRDISSIEHAGCARLQCGPDVTMPGTAAVRTGRNERRPLVNVPVAIYLLTAVTTVHSAYVRIGSTDAGKLRAPDGSFRRQSCTHAGRYGLGRR